MISIEPTTWDDAYFGIKSGKVTLNQEIDTQGIQEILDQARIFDCVVIKNLINNIKNDRQLATIPFNYLCDYQIQFSYKIESKDKVIDKKIKIENNKPFTEEILQISEKVYNYSRFKEDPFFEEHKRRAIYKEWCKNAFEREVKYYLTYEEEGIKGYLLFNMQQDITIELIGVDKSAQHKGIGGRMIKALKGYAEDKGYEKIKVGTQLMNKGAVHFYQQQGFGVESFYSVYHYWPNKR